MTAPTPNNPPGPSTPRPSPPKPGGPGGASNATTAPAIDPVKVALKYKWLIAVSVVVGVFTGYALFILLGRVAPVYNSPIFFEATAPEADVSELNPGTDEDELLRFMNTEINSIESVNFLDSVARDPRLLVNAPEWAAEYQKGGSFDYIEARQDLEKIVNAGVVPETNLFRITVKGDNPNTPFAIAQIVQDVYQERVRDVSRTEMRGRTDLLRRDLEEKEQQIENERRNLRNLIETESIESFEISQDEATQNLQIVNTNLNEIQNSITAIEERIRNMREKLKPDTAIEYSDTQRSLAEERPEVQRFKGQLNEFRRIEQSLINRGFSEHHRERKRIRGEIEATELKLEDARQAALQEVFDQQLSESEQVLAELKAQEADLEERAAEHQAELQKLNQTLTEVQGIEDKLTRLQEQRGGILDDLERLERVVAGRRAGRIELAQPATRPEERSFPKLIPMLAVGVVGICGISGLFIAAREVLDQRVKSPSDVAMIPRARVLGFAPFAGEDPDNPERVETIFRDAPQGVMAESFRQIRNAVLKKAAAGGHRSIMIVPGMPGSGATSMVTNLGLACAACNKRALLIDANFRRPKLHRAFGLDDMPGLADVLSGAADLDTVAQPTGTEGVDIISAGTKDRRVLEHLGSPAMSSLLKEAGGRYDVILVDVAPAVVSGDSGALASVCDASILIVRALAEKRGLVARLRNELADGKAEMLGVIVNAVRASAGGYMRRNIRATFEYKEQAGSETSNDSADESTKAA